MPIPIRTLCVTFVVAVAGCSSTRDTSRDSAAVAAAASERADSSIRVVASDTSRLPANRLRIKVTEDVQSRSSTAR